MVRYFESEILNYSATESNYLDCLERKKETNKQTTNERTNYWELEYSVQCHQRVTNEQF